MKNNKVTLHRVFTASPEKVFIAFTLILILSVNCQAQWKPLFNGKDFDGWSTFLSIPHRSISNLEIPKDKYGNYTQAIGKNSDPLGVFKIGKIDNKDCIIASGQVFGTITYHEAFENYHIKLKYKWGNKKWEPRLNEVRDGGLIYNAYGEEGSSDNTWIPGQECQIQEGDTGDYWPTGFVKMDIPAEKRPDKEFYFYKENAEIRTQFWSNDMRERRIMTDLDIEKPHGEWNTVEVICFEGNSIHIVNGKVVMRLYNSRKVLDGKDSPLKGGKIALQTEGAEIYYSDIKVKHITKIPSKYALKEK